MVSSGLAKTVLCLPSIYWSLTLMWPVGVSVGELLSFAFSTGSLVASEDAFGDDRSMDGELPLFSFSIESFCGAGSFVASSETSLVLLGSTSWFSRVSGPFRSFPGDGFESFPGDGLESFAVAASAVVPVNLQNMLLKSALSIATTYVKLLGLTEVESQETYSAIMMKTTKNKYNTSSPTPSIIDIFSEICSVTLQRQGCQHLNIKNNHFSLILKLITFPNPKRTCEKNEWFFFWFRDLTIGETSHESTH